MQNSTRAIGKNELAAANKGVWILWGKFRFFIYERYHHENPVLNGSPKRDAGDTMHLTRAFTDGMSELHKNEIHDEPATVALVDTYLAQNGYANDFSENRLHHEIYLSDARKVAFDKRKTVIRHPIKKV